MNTQTGQKDKKGKMICVGDTVNLYFYPDEELNRDKTITKEFIVEEASEIVNQTLGGKSFQIVNGNDKRLLSPNLHSRLEVIKSSEKTIINDKDRQALANKMLQIGEKLNGSPLGSLFNSVALIIEMEAETTFLKKNYDFLVFLLRVMKDEEDFTTEPLTYEESEFYRKFSELSDDEPEEFPDIIQ